MRGEAPIIQCFSPAKPCAVLLLNHSYCTFLVYLPPWRGNFLTDLQLSEVTACYLTYSTCNSWPVWQSTEWQQRLTASNFGRMCKGTLRTDSCVLLLRPKQCYYGPCTGRASGSFLCCHHTTFACRWYSAERPINAKLCCLFLKL